VDRSAAARQFLSINRSLVILLPNKIKLSSREQSPNPPLILLHCMSQLVMWWTAPAAMKSPFTLGSRPTCRIELAPRCALVWTRISKSDAFGAKRTFITKMRTSIPQD
jgi:hypothetical protein